MSHLASAEADPAFTQLQVERFREGDRGPGLAHAPSREQRRRAALRRGALRRRALRHRALRHLAVRHGSGRRRARARLALGVVRRAREEARAGREHGLRPPVRRRSAHLDRRRAGRLRGRLSSRHDGHGGPRRRRATPRRGNDLDGRARGRARGTGRARELPSRSSATESSWRSTRASRARSRTRSRRA